MEFLQMNAFVSLAQTLHMPVTAQELNTTQSHISKLIASLEAELGSSCLTGLAGVSCSMSMESSSMSMPQGRSG